ncbi:hypothetical protein HMI56_000609 [Coelomomyces lativittatus]|nr:hypothetical protein HMI56_000609 [Coelomomyces lativittatus]
MNFVITTAWHAIQLSWFIFLVLPSVIQVISFPLAIQSPSFSLEYPEVKSLTPNDLPTSSLPLSKYNESKKALESYLDHVNPMISQSISRSNSTTTIEDIPPPQIRPILSSPSLSLPPIGWHPTLNLITLDTTSSTDTETSEPLPDTIPTYPWDPTLSDTVTNTTGLLLNDTTVPEINDTSTEATQADIVPWKRLLYHDFAKVKYQNAWKVMNECVQGIFLSMHLI